MKSKVLTSSSLLLASTSINDALTIKPGSGLPQQNKVLAASSRRAFVASTITTTTAVSGFPQQPHETGCICTTCNKNRKAFDLFLPKPANAYYERDVGDDGRSSATAAFNIQARETSSRLESSGFKLDTKEDEMKRLSDALSSSTYDSFATSGKKNNVGKGYSGNVKSNYVDNSKTNK